MMSEFFRHGEGFGVILKQLDEVFLNDIAELCAEQHFSWNPISVTSESSV